MNSVQVMLEMESDGSDPPINHEIILKSFQNEEFKLDSNPAEFSVDPKSFVLRPRGAQRIQLVMYPNQIREVQNKLKCLITDMEGNAVESGTFCND